MSLVKANFLSNLDALALYPLTRLLARRAKNDTYQLATSEYVDRLRQLYRTQASAKLQRSLDQRLTLESATLQLGAAYLGADAKQMHGMTIARSSFPQAQQGDPIVLINTTGGHEDDILAHGRIQVVTDDVIRIKLVTPLVLDSGTQADAKEANPPPASEEIAKDEQTKESDDDDVNDDKDRADQQENNEKETEKKPIVHFKIKYNAQALRAARINTVDEHGLLILAILDKFEHVRCDPALHRNLLGFYDERTDQLHEKARVMSFDELVKPRGQQRLAIELAIKRRMSLVEGPAGSGKTLVAAHIAAHMCRLKRAKVLVCSPIQANVDRLAELIDRIQGIGVVKLPDGPIRLPLAEVLDQTRPMRRRTFVGANSSPESGTESNRCLLDKLVDDEIYLHAWNRSRETLHNHSLHLYAHRMVTSCPQHRRRELETKILARADVVCCTNGQAGSYLLDGLKFDMLVLDDVQVLGELDCLVPLMVKGIKQVVLVSDSRKRVRLARSLRRSQSNMHQTADRQSMEQQQIVSAPLEPTASKQNGCTNSNSLRRKNFRSSRSKTTLSKASSTAQSLSAPSSEPSQEVGGLFERLLAVGLPTVDLRVQFRMHETLSNFTNHHFYLGRLRDDAETCKKLEEEIQNNLLMNDESHFNWLPNRKYLTAMYNIKTQEGVASSSTSPKRPVIPSHEKLEQVIDKLDDIVGKLLLHENIQESRIGIILNRKVDKDAEWLGKIPKNIKLGTIADFIGQERDFMILVVVPHDDDDCSNQNHYDLDEMQTKSHISISSEIRCDFKHDDSALNCALTRARLCMIIIAADITVDENDTAKNGNEQHVEALTSDDGCCGWTDLVQYYKASGLLV